MPRRPRILLLTIHACRMPGGGGSVRAHFFTRVAASLGDVTLVSLADATGQKVPDDIRQLCERVVEAPSRFASQPSRFLPKSLLPIIQPQRNAWQHFVGSCLQHLSTAAETERQESFFRKTYILLLKAELRLFQISGSLPPWSSLTWFSEYQRLRPEILTAARERPFDLIWVEDVLSWPYARDLHRALGRKSTEFICNSYNMEFLLARQIAASAPNPHQQRFNSSLSLQLMQMEKEAYSRSLQTFVCSKNDEAVARQFAPAGRFAVIGNGVDLTYFSRDAVPQPTNAHAPAPTLLLTGTFGYLPNQHAAGFFTRDILPRVRQEIPTARFLIAGSNAAALKQQFAADGFEIDADSDPADIRPSFLRADVFVVPLLSGGGTRLKILEAMAMGVPVVSTTIGAEGLGAEHGRQLLLADTPEDFALAVIRLLRDRQFANRMTETARTWVRENYSWDELCRRAAAVVAPLLHNKQEVTA